MSFYLNSTFYSFISSPQVSTNNESNNQKNNSQYLWMLIFDLLIFFSLNILNRQLLINNNYRRKNKFWFI